MTSSRVSLLFFLTICLTCSAAVPRQARPEGVGGVLSGLAGARLANAQRALAKTAFSPTDPYLIADAGGHLLVADSPLLARPEEGDSKQHDSDAAKEDGNRRRRRAFPDHAPSEVLPTGEHRSAAKKTACGRVRGKKKTRLSEKHGCLALKKVAAGSWRRGARGIENSHHYNRETETFSGCFVR